MKNFIFHQIYARYEKNFRKENCPFEKDLLISLWLLFLKSYIFSYMHQKRFHENRKFNFVLKICEIQKMLGNKNFYFKKSLENFFIEVISFVC